MCPISYHKKSDDSAQCGIQLYFNFACCQIDFGKLFEMVGAVNLP